MIPAIDTALVGMRASLDQLERTSQSIANLVSSSSVSSGNLIEDVVQLSLAQHAFEANAAVVRTANEIIGTTIDLLI
ncbi:MAG: hypothetical protein IID14_08135 [Candidatus Marinimicrobia bacterium]|nr:hypothetical protein [Candidatus Neomarinimicrobiota bacterium]